MPVVPLSTSAIIKKNRIQQCLPFSGMKGSLKVFGLALILRSFDDRNRRNRVSHQRIDFLRDTDYSLVRIEDALKPSRSYSQSRA